MTLDELRARIEAAGEPGSDLDLFDFGQGDQRFLDHAAVLTLIDQYVRDALSVEGREAYNDRAGSSSESNSITDPARPVARPNSGGSVDSRRV